MTLFLSIIAFVVILSALILIHEFGHFYVAKKAGIKVEEFALGFGPKLFSFQPKKNDTVYLLKLIPFGGYVKVYGEDSTDKKVLADSQSYASKSPRVKMAVAAAGVVMNFVLALFLLTIGFIAGMQPLFLSSQDVFEGIDKGIVKIEEGMVIKSAKEFDGFTPQTGDQIVSINKLPIITGQELSKLENGQKVVFKILQSNREVKEWELEWNKNDPQIKIFDLVPISRIVVKDIIASPLLTQLGFREGDAILRINDKNIYSIEDLREAIKILENNTQNSAIFHILREGKEESVNIKISPVPKVIISEIYPNTSAEKAGILTNDLVIAINDYPLNSVSDVKLAMEKKMGNQVKYTVQRMGNLIDIFMQPDEKGLVGVSLSPLYYERLGEFNYSIKPILTSITKIEDLRYPFWEAPWKALQESYRLSELSVKTFVNVIGSFLTRFDVPQGVSGPVGIAQMTYSVVQEGFVSLLRFAALLSLSLAILNLFPFPALDGSRFLIILFSVIIGKELDTRIETWLHVIGFLILMSLLVLITYNDIVRIFIGG